jgi:hypothetical protein
MQRKAESKHSAVIARHVSGLCQCLDVGTPARPKQVQFRSVSAFHPKLTQGECNVTYHTAIHFRD